LSLSDGNSPLSKKMRKALKATVENKLAEDRLTLTDQEQQYAFHFINQFAIISEQSISANVSLVLFLRALPSSIKSYELTRIESFNFTILQESLIAYQNTDIVNAFEFYDEKNNQRIQEIKEKLYSQKSELEGVRSILVEVKN